jgi:carbon-monoxide dehydrogenase medium subunit
MTPIRRFEIHQPSTAAEASQMLAKFGDEGGVYAGGTELLLAMRHGALRYSHLVDVKVLPEFDAIVDRGDCIEIGAGATHRAIERSPMIRERLPVVSDMESRVANIRVRASGTIGGNLCFAEPHSDPATLLMALEATACTAGPLGVRELQIHELISGAYSNSLQPNEILTSIRVPCPQLSLRAAYVKYQVHERPTLGLAIAIETSDAGETITGMRVAIGCLCPFPRRSASAEQLLIGERSKAEQQLGAAADVLADEAELIDDQDGGADYKRHLLRVFLQRAMEKALELNSSRN